MSSLKGSEYTVDQRTDPERRDFSWRTVFFGYLRSRRRETRRAGELEPLFTDYHHPWLFFLATSIMLLSSFDAFFTLQLIDRGAIEINPVMAAVIGESALTFSVTKMLLTSFGILALVFLARSKFMNIIRTGLILTFFFSCYAVLVCYEFVSLMAQN